MWIWGLAWFAVSVLVLAWPTKRNVPPRSAPPTAPGKNRSAAEERKEGSGRELEMMPLVRARTVPFRHAGEIHLIIGCMKSEKTSEIQSLFRKYRRSSNAIGSQCLLIKYAHDTRYDKDAVVTHSQVKEFDCTPCTSLDEVEEKAAQAQAIFIDEGQFFQGGDRNIVRWALQRKVIYIGALDAYDNQQLWPVIAKLIPFATTITKKHATCKCGGDALLSVRKAGQQGRIEIGGDNIYDVQCLFCFNFGH